MAPLPPSNTKRWFLNYECGGLTHTVQMRSLATITPANASSAFDQYLDALAPSLHTITIINLEVSELGSNVRNVAPWTGQLTYGTTPQTAVDRPNFVSFVGRSAGGRRVRVTQFGWAGTDDPDYRYVQGQNVNIDGALTILNGLPSSFIAIDGIKPLFHLYGNFGWNAYWQRKIRP